MAHNCTVTRKEGMYHLECEACGLITKQPANRGGLIARGERHHASNGREGGPKNLQKKVVAGILRGEVREEQLDRIIETYGEVQLEVKKMAKQFPSPEPMEPGGANWYEPPPVVLATPKTYVRPAFQQAMVDNKCMKCGGELRNAEGAFCTTAFPVKAVCHTCKNGVPA